MQWVCSKTRENPALGSVFIWVNARASSAWTICNGHQGVSICSHVCSRDACSHNLPCLAYTLIAKFSLKDRSFKAGRFAKSIVCLYTHRCIEQTTWQAKECIVGVTTRLLVCSSSLWKPAPYEISSSAESRVDTVRLVWVPRQDHERCRNQKHGFPSKAMIVL